MCCRSEGALAPRSSSAHSTVTISTSCSQARHQATIECPRTLTTRCVSVCDTVRLRTRTYHLALSARFGRNEQVATILREGRAFVASVPASAAKFTPSPKLIVSDQAEATGAAANWSDNRPSPARGAMIVCFVRNVFIGSPPATIEGVEPASPSE